ncbi:hypothetical protein MHU86_23305 [Fragilaria crotonensis]|nr:hypothetical protein MHU86_23305 [Fragilaria crotonensis]
MNAALQRCGFNAPTVTWLIAQGFATLNDLMLATESDLDSIARTTGFEANPESFTADKVPEFTAKCQEYQEQKEAAKDEDASKPDSLKKLVNWALWNESFQNYSRQILSAAKIPLVNSHQDERKHQRMFLIQRTLEVQWSTLLKRRYSRTTLRIDNPILSGIEDICRKRRRMVIHQEIERSQDGRKAYLALKTQCEGTASKITRQPRESKERNISGVKSGEKTDKTAKAGKLPKGFKLENKYYPPKIFRLLSQEQKDQLKEWGDKKGKRSVAALKKQIKEELKNEMKKLAKGNDNDGDDDHESSADEAAGKEFVAALTRRSRSWIRPDNAEPLRWFRGRYTSGLQCNTRRVSSLGSLRDNDVHVDERHRQHAPDSIFGILVPSEPLRIPFTLEGVVAGFDSRPPTQDELDNTALHVELTSDVEWIPHTFALSLAEEDVLDSEDEEEITNL